MASGGKLFSKALSAFTLGTSDLVQGKQLGAGLTGAVDPAEAAAKQQAAVAAQQAIISQNATALASNNTVSNTANVIAGGSADASADGSDLIKKRQASLSSTLGIS